MDDEAKKRLYNLLLSEDEGRIREWVEGIEVPDATEGGDM